MAQKADASASSAAEPEPRPVKKWTAAPTTVVGELMVTVGALLGLLVVWELFWTDVGANREQAGIVDGLGPAWDPGSVPLILPAEGTPGLPAIPPELMERVLPPPVYDAPANGETFGTLYVPRWGYNYIKPISEGVSRYRVLDSKGIGRYPKSEMPGDLGNFAIAAHRTTYGKPFSDIDKLKVGDAIVVRTQETWYVYTVIEKEIVAPSHVQSVRSNPFEKGGPVDRRLITLTSCHPKYSALQRYIVHGELDYWAPVEAGYPPEIIAPEGEEA